jgi:hypothetical protein
VAWCLGGESSVPLHVWEFNLFQTPCSGWKSPAESAINTRMKLRWAVVFFSGALAVAAAPSNEINLALFATLAKG